jgi:hypothetical protein
MTTHPAARSTPLGRRDLSEAVCEPSSVTAFLTEEHIVIDNPA